MKKLISIFLMILLVSISGCNSNIKTVEDSVRSEKIIYEDLGTFFKGYEGCFVLFDKNNNEYCIYNENKSNKRVSPCSTFKIILSLIGLETKTIKDEKVIFKWDGTQYPKEVADWNRDHNLKTALTYSVNWYFYKLVSQINEDELYSYVQKLNYGNKDITGGKTKFWEQSSLKISPKEQVEWLRKFYDYQIPFSKRNIDILKQSVVVPNNNGNMVFGRTGTGGTADYKIVNGWFIGYIEKNNNVYFFATNIEGKDKASGKKAKEICTKILEAKKLY